MYKPHDGFWVSVQIPFDKLKPKQEDNDEEVAATQR